jgi:ketopantoate reductase
MRFAVAGAGAIGAFAGAMLARSGEDVTLIAREAHLRAMQEWGARVRGSLGEFEARPAATDDPASVAVVDVVLLTLKAHSLTEMAPRLQPLLGPETCVVSAQNGIPWWYFYRHGGEWEGMRLETVDPGGVINCHLDPARVVGCVVYPSTIIVEPRPPPPPPARFSAATWRRRSPRLVIRRRVLIGRHSFQEDDFPHKAPMTNSSAASIKRDSATAKKIVG